MTASKSIKNNLGALRRGPGVLLGRKDVEQSRDFIGRELVPGASIETGSPSRHDPHRMMLIAETRRNVSWNLDWWKAVDDFGETIAGHYNYDPMMASPNSENGPWKRMVSPPTRLTK